MFDMALDDKPQKANIQIGTAVGTTASMNTTQLMYLCTLVVKQQKANAESKAKKCQIPSCLVPAALLPTASHPA